MEPQLQPVHEMVPEMVPEMVVEPLVLPDAQGHSVNRVAEPEMQQPRDYATDLVQALRNASEQQEMSAPGAQPLFAESNAVAERDLDVPAFLRRLKF